MVNFVKKVRDKIKDAVRKNPEFSNEILYYLLLGGTFAVMSVSPAFLTPAILFAKMNKKTRSEKQAYQTFYYLRKRNLIHIEHSKDRISLTLTKKGKQQAQKYAISRDFRIKIPAVWDKIWRLVLFDIPSRHRVKRDALRHMLKRLGFYQLQKSAWVYPFDCSKEISYLKDFFSLNDEEVRLVAAYHLGEESSLKKYFEI